MLKKTDYCTDALELWSIHRGLKYDPDMALRRIRKETDFRNVEVAGTWGVSKTRFAEMLSDLDLNVIGVHVGPPSVMTIQSDRDFKLYCAYLKREADIFSTKRLVVMRDPSLRQKHFLLFARSIRDAAAFLREYGVTLMFHPYDYDWVPKMSPDGKDKASGRLLSFSQVLAKFQGIKFQIDLFYIVRAAERLNVPVLEFIESTFRDLPKNALVSLHLNGWERRPDSNPSLVQASLNFSDEFQNVAAKVFGKGNIDTLIVEHDCLDKQASKTGIATPEEVENEWTCVLNSYRGNRLGSPFQKVKELWVINHGRH